MKAAIAITTLATLVFASCTKYDAPSAVERQRAQASQEAAAGQSYCYECENIKNRRLLFGKPGVVGYVTFLNHAGQPVMYFAVRGKCTSGGKRLDPTQASIEVPSYDENGRRAKDSWQWHLADAPSEDGTYGHSEQYVYCWTTDGRYVQWSGEYLYSDKPFDLTIKPLVVNMSTRETAQ